MGGRYYNDLQGQEDPKATQWVEDTRTKSLSERYRNKPYGLKILERPPRAGRFKVNPMGGRY